MEKLVNQLRKEICWIFWKWWFQLERNLQLTIPGCAKFNINYYTDIWPPVILKFWNWYFFITTMFSVRWGRWIPWTPFCLFPDYSEILGRNGVAIGGGGRGVVISHLSAKDILFGKMVYKDNLFINHILLVGKQYIYYRRYTNTNPCLQVFLARLGNVYQY